MVFTAQMIFDITMSLMSETKANSSAYLPYFLNILNSVLQECLPAENGIRESEEEELLEASPFLVSLEEEIPYHQVMLLNVVPYGVAVLLAMGDDQNEKATYFSTKYVENMQQYGSVQFIEVVDVY